MVNQALMIEWGMPIEGRETMALEIFNSHIQWWTQQQEEKRINGFRTFGTLTGDFGRRSGFLLIDGTIDQIDTLRHADDFRERVDEVLNVVHDVHLTTLETGELMMKRMMRYGQNVKRMLHK